VGLGERARGPPWPPNIEVDLKIVKGDERSAAESGVLFGANVRGVKPLELVSFILYCTVRRGIPEARALQQSRALQTLQARSPVSSPLVCVALLPVSDPKTEAHNKSTSSCESDRPLFRCRSVRQLPHVSGAAAKRRLEHTRLRLHQDRSRFRGTESLRKVGAGVSPPALDDDGMSTFSDDSEASELVEPDVAAVVPVVPLPEVPSLSLPASSPPESASNLRLTAMTSFKLVPVSKLT
jgi:hypothetical protein